MLAPKTPPPLTNSERSIRKISDKIDSVYYWLAAAKSTEFEPLVSDLGEARELLGELQAAIDAERGEEQRRVFEVLKGGE